MTCGEGETVLKFKGGYYTKNIFESLAEFGITTDYPYFNYFAVYDYEALLKPVQSDKQWTAEHQAISVSICSNVPGFEKPSCFVNSDNKELVKAKLNYLEQIQSSASAYIDLKWAGVRADILTQLKAHAQLEGGSMERDLEKIKVRFDAYTKQLPIIGYNSSRYDLNLVKSCIAHSLNLDRAGCYVIKKQNAYTSIKTPLFNFVDANNFVAPGTSYDKFLKSYHCVQEKSYFPYEWFDCETKLDFDRLPDSTAFYSKIKGQNVLGFDAETIAEKHKQLLQIWKDNNMSTFKDWLIYYNNLDVEPFVDALSKMHTFYRQKNIDVFKQTISVPGIARLLLFRAARSANVDDRNKDLHKTVKSNIVGGPSIIFQRHMKKGETKIRNGEQTCQSVTGYDCNALYLWALSQDMPVGPFIRRRAESNLKAVKSDCFLLVRFCG